MAVLATPISPNNDRTPTAGILNPPFPDNFLLSPPIGGRTSIPANTHSSIAALTCITPLANQRNGAVSSMPISPDIIVVGEILSTMKLTLNALGTTFDSLGEQTAKVAQLGPAMETARQVDLLRTQIDEQYARQEKRIREVKALLRDKIKEQLADHLRSHAQEAIKAKVEKEVKNRVRDQLNTQIPMSLRQQVKRHKRQILEVQTSLHNSEARRHNALLRSASLTEPLRPLLRPFAIQSPSPAPSNLLKPTIRVSPPFSPVVPSPPAPTPAVHKPTDSDSEDTAVEPPTPSPHFPRDLGSLFKLSPDAARELVKDYGLVVETDKSRQPSPLDDKRTPSEGDEDSRESNLNRFMAHIGVPFKMVPAPGSPPGSSPLVTSA